MHVRIVLSILNFQPSGIILLTVGKRDNSTINIRTLVCLFYTKRNTINSLIYACYNCPVDFKLSMMILDTIRWNVESVATP